MKTLGRLNVSRRRLEGKEGFSLVELMVVVSIIGILAALAVPRFQTFQAKARQSEAKTNLSHIYTLQQTYHGENSIYVAFQYDAAISCPVGGVNPVGFALTDCAKIRYNYRVVLNGSTQTFTASAYNAAAKHINPSCPTTLTDTWTIDHNKVLLNTIDATKC